MLLLLLLSDSSISLLLWKASPPIDPLVLWCSARSSDQRDRLNQSSMQPYKSSRQALLATLGWPCVLTLQCPGSDRHSSPAILT